MDAAFVRIDWDHLGRFGHNAIGRPTFLKEFRFLLDLIRTTIAYFFVRRYHNVERLAQFRGVNLRRCDHRRGQWTFHVATAAAKESAISFHWVKRIPILTTRNSIRMREQTESPRTLTKFGDQAHFGL